MMLNLEIFWVFFKIGFLSFGGVFGVLPELERMIVLERHWVTHDQFIQSYVIGQFLPGPNMVMCPLIGFWVNGYQGLVAGFIGIYSVPLLIMGSTYYLFTKYKEIHWVRRTEVALRPLVFGLLSIALLKLWWMQSVGISGSFVPLFRAAALVFSAGGIWLVFKKKLGSLSAVFVIGAFWWLTNWLLLLAK